MHLKDIDYTKNGKRWSQVMYMNYLVKYKINVLKEEKIAAYRKSREPGNDILRNRRIRKLKFYFEIWLRWIQKILI